MNKNCLLCGVGGQGTVLASKLIAYAALDKGMFVRTTETIGMAQRGGSVVSHVRMGEEIFSPMIPKGQADVMIAFEPAEAVRNLSYLKEGGIAVVNMKAVKPVTATLNNAEYTGQEMIEYLKEHVKHLILVDGEAICEEVGSAKVLNVTLLGAALASNVLDLSLQDMEKEIETHVKKQFVEMNKKALAHGAAAVL
jgi:indolepyruvate ferredoxin oxidoreductase beta subunit